MPAMAVPLRRIAALLVAGAAALAQVLPAGAQHAAAPSSKRTVALAWPSEETIPAGALGEAIRRGRDILGDTQRLAGAYVGNGLNCTSCHLDYGRVANAAPWVGLWGMFPEYRPRNAIVNTLQDRVNDCFQRSLNGRALAWDSDEMRGIVSYIWWLSKDVPTGVEVHGRGFRRMQSARVPDPVRGAQIYLTQCAACHAADGQGMSRPDGGYLIPPLWGERSFNIGAGMARLNTAAAFVKSNMPLGNGNSLSDEDAFDVAAYFINQPRPDFAAKHLDWPKGGKPADARY